MAKVEDKLPRNINSIYTMIDGMPDIIFEHEQRPVIDPNQPHFMRRYTSQSLSNTFRAMGCQAPLNNSMAEWIFSFLQNCPGPEAAQILGSSSDIFRNLRTYSRGFLVLTRMQFHRLVCAALHVHMFRKVRYCVDFRLALDFTENRRFFIVLLSGAPGTGKSTIASLIASRMSVEHILSTDSIRHAMRTFYPQKDYPILYKSTYECGDLVDPDHTMSEEERCVKGYLAQSDLVGNQLMNIVSSFVNSHASLVVEGVHLNINIMLKVVQIFPNVVPFLIYIKKEDFHRQRFAVRAKYMTTDPSANRYISNFSAIRYVQTYLSKGANKHLVPKIDNRNIDRSLETIHQTLFSYLKKLEGRNSMYDPSTERLTFLDSVWRRRKQKLASKAKTLKTIRALKGEFLNNSNNANNNPTNSTNNNETNGENLAILHQQQQDSLEELMSSLPTEGEQINKEESDDTEDVDVIKYLRNGTMILSHEKIVQSKPKVEKKETEEKDEFQHWPMYKTDSQMEFADGDTDIAEVTLTDFVETTDSEYTDLSSILINLKDRQQQLQPPSQS